MTSGQAGFVRRQLSDVRQEPRHLNAMRQRPRPCICQSNVFVLPSRRAWRSFRCSSSFSSSSFDRAPSSSSRRWFNCSTDRRKLDTSSDMAGGGVLAAVQKERGWSLFGSRNRNGGSQGVAVGFGRRQRHRICAFWVLPCQGAALA